MAEYHPADEMRCPMHFCVGQEAMPAALAQVLRRDDVLMSHYRSHGYYLAKGAPLDAMVAEFRARRDLVLKEVAKIDRLSADRPSGAFYVFPKVDVRLDSATLCERILKEASVAVTPGSAFGEAGEGHIRISYAASRETITEGVRRIGEVLAKLG